MHGLTGFRRWQLRHPRQVDALVASFAFVVAVWGPSAKGSGGSAALAGWATVFTAVASMALLVRRRVPLTVWLVCLAVVLERILSLGGPTSAISLTLVALYTVGAQVRTGWAVLVTALTGIGYVLSTDGFAFGPVSSMVGFSAAAAAVGIAIQGNRSALAAAESRARQAEISREDEAERRVTQERLRIARELHDVVAHHVSVINVQAGVARHFVDAQPQAAKAALHLVRGASRTVLAEMSTVLGLLRTESEQGLRQPAPNLDSIQELVETIERAGLHVDHQCVGEPYRMSEVPELTVYRVVQESLTNALKHGEGGTVSLRLTFQPEAVLVQVDNPVPELSRSTNSGGHGLIGMRERVASVDGQFEAGSSGSTFTVRAEIPREHG